MINIIYQIVTTLLEINKSYPGFRHNNLCVNMIECYLYDDDGVVTPLIKFNNFYLSQIDNLVPNNIIFDMAIPFINSPYSDLFIFIKDLQHNYSDTLSKFSEINNFINDIIPTKLQKIESKYISVTDWTNLSFDETSEIDLKKIKSHKIFNDNNKQNMSVEKYVSDAEFGLTLMSENSEISEGSIPIIKIGQNTNPDVFPEPSKKYYKNNMYNNINTNNMTGKSRHSKSRVEDTDVSYDISENGRVFRSSEDNNAKYTGMRKINRYSENGVNGIEKKKKKLLEIEERVAQAEEDKITQILSNRSAKEWSDVINSEKDDDDSGSGSESGSSEEEGIKNKNRKKSSRSKHKHNNDDSYNNYQTSGNRMANLFGTQNAVHPSLMNKMNQYESSMYNGMHPQMMQQYAQDMAAQAPMMGQQMNPQMMGQQMNPQMMGQQMNPQMMAPQMMAPQMMAPQMMPPQYAQEMTMQSQMMNNPQMMQQQMNPNMFDMNNMNMSGGGKSYPLHSHKNYGVSGQPFFLNNTRGY
jgi:hypothetical protein